jgi:DNA sulfur modification protein DndD
MIIKKITVENFQSYHGKQTIEFSKGLNLIIGNGGKGKSKLFNAFYWVLFGKIYITDIGWCSTDDLPDSAQSEMERQDFINKKALFDAQPDQDITVSICIELENDKGAVYNIERFATARYRGSDGQENDRDVSICSLKVSYDSNSGTQVKNGAMAVDTINELFPESIRNYIWFQGESLDNLINFRNKKTLESAVKHISYFPYYEKLLEIISKSKVKIENIETKKIKEQNSHNANIKRMTERMESLRKLIHHEEKKKEQVESDMENIKSYLFEERKKISGLAQCTKLVQEYEKCKQDIQNIMHELTKLDEYQRKQVPHLWILRATSPMIKKFQKIVAEYTEEQNTIPEKKYLDNPSRPKLEEILKKKQCYVCGSDVSDNSPAYRWIMKRLKDQEDYLREMEEYRKNMQFAKQFERLVGSIQDYPDSLLLAIKTIGENYKRSEDDIEELLLRKKTLKNKQEEIDKQIEEMKSKHNVDPIQDAKNADRLESNINGSRTLLDNKQRELNILQQTLDQYKDELKNLERDLDTMREKGEITTVQETEQKNISTFLVDVCKQVREQARKDLLHKIDERANDFYRKFTSHDSGYKGNVKIRDDYSIEFDPGLNTSHEDRKKMSIINAMLSLNQEALDTFYPFISDAPTSSFDPETTHKYLLGIKDIFRQSIIMTKDVDINSANFHSLKNENKISRIYLLDSKQHCIEKKDPDLHEVSTVVKKLK